MLWAFIRVLAVVALEGWLRRRNSGGFAFETLLTSSSPLWTKKRPLSLLKPSWSDGLFEEMGGSSTRPHALPSARRASWKALGWTYEGLAGIPRIAAIPKCRTVVIIPRMKRCPFTHPHHSTWNPYLLKLILRIQVIRLLYIISSLFSKSWDGKAFEKVTEAIGDRVRIHQPPGSGISSVNKRKIPWTELHLFCWRCSITPVFSWVSSTQGQILSLTREVLSHSVKNSIVKMSSGFP